MMEEIGRQGLLCVCACEGGESMSVINVDIQHQNEKLDLFI